MSSSQIHHSESRIQFDSPAQELYLNLWRTYDCLKSIDEELFSQYQLSPQQYNLLRILQHVHPESLPTLKLGRAMISRSPDITRMLDRLEQRGLIQRLRRELNRRVVQVQLTPAGLELLEEVADQVREMHERQLGHLAPEEQQQLLKLLKLARSKNEDGSCGWLGH